MKSRFLLFFVVAGLMCSCDRDNSIPIEEEKAAIDGVEFIPDESSVEISGEQLIITFKSGAKEVKIITNNIVEGEYSMVSQPVKPPTTFEANIEYTNGTDIYKGLSGTLTLTRDDTSYSGGYKAVLKSETDGTEIEISGGSFEAIESTIEGGLITDETAIKEALLSYYPAFNKFIQFEFLFDAVYSNQSSIPNDSWSAIYNHTHKASNPKVQRLWNEGWDVIYKMNVIILSATEYVSNEASKKEIIAEAKVVRAYTSFKLLEWFNDLPIVEGLEDDLLPARSASEEVLQWIIDDIKNAQPDIPEAWPDSAVSRITKIFTQAALSRIYLYGGDYIDTQVVNQEIVNSGAYSLSPSTTDFTKDNVEIFWGFVKENDEEFDAFFTKGDYVPVMRYTETVLSVAEVAYATGTTAQALDYMNMLKQRRGEADLSSVDVYIIREQYEIELELEGDSFLLMKRHDIAQDVLQIPNFMDYLPIPENVIDNNPDVSQNPGY